MNNGELVVNFDGPNEGLSENTKYNKFVSTYDKGIIQFISEDKKSYEMKLKDDVKLAPGEKF